MYFSSHTMHWKNVGRGERQVCKILSHLENEASKGKCSIEHGASWLQTSLLAVRMAYNVEANSCCQFGWGTINTEPYEHELSASTCIVQWENNTSS